MPAIIRKIFEDEARNFLNVDDAIAVNSGTAALIAPLWSMDLQPGDEVITTSFTFIATSNAIIISGGTPVFVDIDPETLLIDPNKIEAAITKKTKAIIPVNLYGRICDMGKINKVAAKHNLIVIEDTAQAFGAEKDGQYAGTFGDIGTYSFYKTKNISTFEGGLITINKNSKLDGAKIRSICDQGQVGKYNHEYVGFNFRMPEPCALIGLEAIKIHMIGIKAELGLRGPIQGHYPKVVYDQPVYKRRGITGNCPVAERIASEIANETFVDKYNG